MLIKIVCVAGIIGIDIFLKWLFNGCHFEGDGKGSLVGSLLYNILIGVPFTLYLYWLFVTEVLLK